MKTHLSSFVILFVIVLVSCAPKPAINDISPTSTSVLQVGLSETPAFTPTTASTVQAYETETNPSLPIPSRADPQVLIETAREDLAYRLSDTVTSINPIEIDEVLWPDASLGCPQPGNVYAQTQTSGYLIKLEHNGNEFEYHADLHGFIFYCENPTPPVSATPIDIHP